MLVYFGDSFKEETDLSKSHWLKSCPECSRKAGQVVYKKYPEDFGESEAESRQTQTHRGSQSWCSECRSTKKGKK